MIKAGYILSIVTACMCSMAAQAQSGEPVQIGLEVVAEGLTAPVFLTHPGDGSGRLFIVDQAGQIRVVKDDVLLPLPFLDISSRMVSVNPVYDERGLLGLAFHPDYASNGRFFVRYSAPRAGDSEEPCNQPGFIVGCHEEILAEFRVLGDPGSSDVADPASEVIHHRVNQPQFNHNGGQVAFGPDGLLYLSLGDGGGANDGLADEPPSHGSTGFGQDVTSPLGSILRIDVDAAPSPGLTYAIPPGNPFASGGGAAEVYAYGFRNPYRFSFDGQGSLYVGDVGQNLFEEIDIVPVLTTPGLLNYGWVVREGFECFDPLAPTTPPANCATTGSKGEPLRDPVMSYTHAEGLAIVGGYVYRGSMSPALKGQFIFGDFSRDFGPSGRLFYTSTSGPDAFQLNEFFLLPNGAPLGQAVFGIGEDEQGELYLLASDNIGPNGTAGVIYRLVDPTSPVYSSIPVPSASWWSLIALVASMLIIAGLCFPVTVSANPAKTGQNPPARWR
jgi:glucose/arabinose dehydrogenase